MMNFLLSLPMRLLNAFQGTTVIRGEYDEGGLIGGIKNAFNDLLNNFINWLIEKIVIPVLEALMILIKYVFSGLFYSISSFLLNLIDFMEILFRSLAGLPATGDADIQFVVSGNTGIGAGSKDLLMQFITHPTILAAFEATAIVGIFLLIITTIFQMIKVEYTTEGAENNKTKILGKSLKSLTNLLLIPALCVFGIFIGNQILDLIDTATKGGDGAKISGTLFVAAASNAIYDGEGYYFNINQPSDMLKLSIRGAVVESKLAKTKNDDGSHTAFYIGDAPNREKSRETIESNVRKCASAFNYSNIEDISVWYNIFEVNYLVLIFGACIILKSLFFILFGMIDRLYRCLALFIAAPFVIGMSPIKDSLGSWRSNFIGKALAAYGTVISMNLFLTIVTLFLNIKIVPKNIGTITPLLSSSFCDGLVKSIFVICGCMMMEKLAGELGGYFGASDGLAAGKSLAGEATAGLAKAAAVGTGLAVGGASLAFRAGKGAVGLAGKLGKGVGKGVGKVAGFADDMLLGGRGGRFVSKVGGGIKDLASDAGSKIKNSKIVQKGKAGVEKIKSSIQDKKQQWSEKHGYKGPSREELSQMNDLISRYSKGESLSASEQASLDKFRVQHFRGVSDGQLAAKFDKTFAPTLSRMNAMFGVREGAKGVWEDAKVKGKKAWENTKETASGLRDRAEMVAGGIAHWGTEGLKSALPKQLTGFGSTMNKHIKAYADENDYTKEAYGKIEKARADKKAEWSEGGAIASGVVARQQRNMIQIFQTEAGVKMVEAQNETNNQLNKLADKLADVLERANKSKDDKVKHDYLMQQAYGIQDQMKDLNGSVEFNIETNETENLKEAIDAANSRVNKEIEKLKEIVSINKGKDKNDIIKAIEEHMAKLGEEKGGDKMMKAIMKALEEIKSQIGK